MAGPQGRSVHGMGERTKKVGALGVFIQGGFWKWSCDVSIHTSLARVSCRARVPGTCIFIPAATCPVRMEEGKWEQRP